MVDDDELFFSMGANTTYSIRFVMFLVLGASGGARMSINGPSSPASINCNILTVLQIPASTGFNYIMNILSGSSAYGTLILNFPMANIVCPLEFSCLVKNGPNAGVFSVQLAQLFSSAVPTTFQAGSYLEYMEV